MFDNETRLYPFDWGIMEIGGDDDSVSIEGLMINGRFFKQA